MGSAPPLHIRHMERCREARHTNPKLTLQELGQMLGLNRMAVKRCS